MGAARIAGCGPKTASKWLKEYGSQGCKDVMTVDDYLKLETHLESSVKKIRTPATALAGEGVSQRVCVKLARGAGPPG